MQATESNNQLLVIIAYNSIEINNEKIKRFEPVYHSTIINLLNQI